MFGKLWTEIEDIGRDAHSGGYRRYAWNDADLEMREWFAGTAVARGLDYVEDGNGNQFAWWGSAAGGSAAVGSAAGGLTAGGLTAGGNALMVGSHLDSVPDGGAFDGPLGVVSSFVAVDELVKDGFEPNRPIVIANFSDEEGARFGIACAGSQLLTGKLDPERALSLTDRDGLSLAEVLRSLGRNPDRLGPDAEFLGRIGTFVELHVEQGKNLAYGDQGVGVASSIWPHGRYRFDFGGEANHAGATAMADRRDPMLAFAATVLAARERAVLREARATFGRIEVEPGGTNAIPSRVRAWLDARAADADTLTRLVDELVAVARAEAESTGTTVDFTAESVTGSVDFDGALRDDLSALLGDAPILPTGAGHDAGVLSDYGIDTAMLFVRNPTGVSHSPAEFAEESDCLAGVAALKSVIAHLAGGDPP